MEHFDSSIIEPIEMRMIKHSPFEVRHKIDKNDPEFRSLVKSITEHGLLQPILVRPVALGFEIVAGYRRFEACRSLRWRHIQSKIRELSDKQTYEIQLTENIQRKSLNALEEAEAFKKYVDDFGWGGVSELASKIEKSEEYVSHRIQLLKLPSEAKKQLIQNALSVSQSLELLGVPSEEQAEMAQRIYDDHLTVKQIRSIKKSKVKKDDDPRTTKAEQSHRITKKTKLGLKMALSRIDSVANESQTISDPKVRREVVTYMMDLRYKLHELLDETIHFERVTLRKTLKL
jgi:ParB family chromosome partitioning protein|tara:strand:- start:831 stop:1694 length:864 start_codon:yes stop_codon:yes gene_type:complete